MNDSYLMRRHEVERAVGLSRSSIYAYMANDAFPKPIRVGRKAVRWRSDTIYNWVEERSKG